MVDLWGLDPISEALPNFVSATVWALGYMTQVPSHLSLTPG
jgi:hypothetical protein